MRPTIREIVYSWRSTLAERLDPPIKTYIQSNELLNVELVSTSEVTDAPVSSIGAGEANMVVTAAAITVSQECIWVLLQAHPDNTDNILIGNSATQTYVLIPGGTVTLPVPNVANIIGKSASGTQVLNGIWGVK